MEGPESQLTIFDILKDCVAYEVIKTSKDQQEDGKGATKSRLRNRRLNPEFPNDNHDLAEESRFGFVHPLMDVDAAGYAEGCQVGKGRVVSPRRLWLVRVPADR